MTVDEARTELEMWGRWARQVDGPKGYGEPSIWEAWLNFRGRVAGWGLTAAEKEQEARGVVIVPADDWEPPIDVLMAEAADDLLCELRRRDGHSYTLLWCHFYRRQRQRWEDLDPALRQYCDLSNTA
jgi:hypothetical protein